MNIQLSPKDFFIKNLYLIFLLLLIHIFSIVSTFDIDYQEIQGMAQFFHFDYERNIPTFYSALALLFAGILLFLIARKQNQRKLPYLSWGWLSLIFIFLSVDEMFSIHEKLITPFREAFGTSGFLYYSWVIPYSILLITLAIAYSNFLMDLPKKTSLLFVISGVIYISGAIGFEMLGAREVVIHGKNTLLFSFLITLEELLEMAGIAVFIYALLKYIVLEFGDFIIRITEKLV